MVNCLVFIERDQSEAHNMFGLINKIKVHKKFTLAIENDHEYNYRDLIFIKKNGTLQFGISRKTIRTDAFHHSKYHNQHKLSIFLVM